MTDTINITFTKDEITSIIRENERLRTRVRHLEVQLNVSNLTPKSKVSTPRLKRHEAPPSALKLTRLLVDVVRGDDMKVIPYSEDHEKASVVTQCHRIVTLYFMPVLEESCRLANSK